MQLRVRVLHPAPDLVSCLAEGGGRCFVGFPPGEPPQLYTMYLGVALNF